ncbi:MAG: hypothetical protein ACREOL_09540 [Candidatus Dormibacteria bacterium]
MGLSLRRRFFMWGRFALAGGVAGGIAALGASSLPGALGVGLASAGLASLNVGRLHYALHRPTLGAAAIRSQVANNLTLAYVLPWPGVVAIVVASDRGAPGLTMAAVIAAAFAFTWLAWEGAIAVVSRSHLARRAVTRWEAKASEAQQARLASAESHWRDRDW